LLLPMPEKWRNSARFSLFFDIGGIFSDQNIRFVGEDVQTVGRENATRLDYGFNIADLKKSAGLAVQWLAPLGVFRFSYAVPLNKQKSDGINWGDETEGFQFSIGQAF